MTMELDQSPDIVNVLVFCDHFAKHIMMYMTPDQTANTVTEFLWQGHILIFGAPAKLLNNWGTTFESNIIISKLCELMGIQKVGTSPYHPQTNGQVEWSHQTLMWMIGKLGKDQKAEWPKHLSELVYAHKSTRSAITGYSPHYLMFRWLSHLPIDFYFPTVVSTEKHQHVGHYVADLHEYCAKPSRKPKCSPHLRLRGKGDTMILRPMPFHWNQVTWSWSKLIPTMGRERWKTSGRKNHRKWNAGLLKASLHTSWRTSGPDTLTGPPSESTFSHHSHHGSSFMYRCMSWVDKVCHHHPGVT